MQLSAVQSIQTEVSPTAFSGTFSLVSVYRISDLFFFTEVGFVHMCGYYLEDTAYEADHS